MNIILTRKQEDFIAALISSGDYQNASEAVRDAIRLHELYRHKVVDQLRAEIEKGWNSPNIINRVQDIIKAKRHGHKK